MSQPDEETSRLEAIVTRWSLLGQARDGSEFSSAEARNALALRYVPAVRRYVGAILRDDHDADDVTQDVVVRLLAGDFGGADPNRGRFRDLLKTAVRNMVRNYLNRQKRRRGSGLDPSLLEEEGDASGADDPWTGEWRKQVLDLAWNSLQQEQRRRPQGNAYAVLRLRMDYPDDSSEQLAARLSQQLGREVKPDAFRQQLKRARTLFAELLVAEVSRGLANPSPEAIQEEFASLGLLPLVRDLLPSE